MQLEDTVLRFRNKEASQELIVGIHMDAVIDSDEAKEHIRKNIQHDVPWLLEKTAHDAPAIVCGAAPSLLNCLDDIRKRQSAGAKIFACNSSSQLLRAHGIVVNYQVILDSGEITLTEFDEEAPVHLLASVCQPDLFKLAKNPILWHPSIESVIEQVESLPRDFSYIGGGVTVTNSALAIVYTLGHREIDVYGVDSSHEGEAFYADGRSLKDVNSQQLPVIVEHMGKEYKTTYDMKQQVVVFMKMAQMLQKEGCAVRVHGSGLLPDVWNLAIHE